MISRVTEYLKSVGMWTLENKPKYDFRLSPEVFTVSANQISQLEKFAEKLHNYFQTKTDKFPSFCKIDLMINKNGDLKIAEIDGLNKRAFGYAILERKIAQMFGNQSSRFFSGIENVLKEKLGSKKLFIVVSGREKYYQYGFNILTESLCNIGVEAQWGHEKEAIKLLNSIDPCDVVLLDIPITGHAKLDSLLANTDWDVLIPNEPLFSSKANLVELTDPLVPITLRGSEPNPFKTFVIKHIGKSGCKGIYFSDDIQKISTQEINDEYIIQEYIAGKEFSFNYFEGTSLIKSEGWQVRLIATLDLEDFKVVDMDITARQDRLVHGASDSIQIAGVRD